jgi:hypothetical protein
MDALNWRKASYSASNGGCVEVADHDSRVLVRDTQDRTGPALQFSSMAWRKFASGVKADASLLSASSGHPRLRVPLLLSVCWGAMRCPFVDILPWVPDEKICYWGGWGGSMIVMDVGRRMTISCMMNKMGPGVVGSDRGAEYGQAIYDAVIR